MEKNHYVKCSLDNPGVRQNKNKMHGLMANEDKLANLPYPKLDRDLCNNVKISKKDYPQIKLLYLSGLSSRTIGKMYNVNHSTILVIVNPKLKEKKYAYNQKYRKEARKNPIYKQRMVDFNKKSYARRCNLVPLKEWYKLETQRRRDLNE